MMLSEFERMFIFKRFIRNLF